MLLLFSPPPVEACDVGAAEAAVSRLEDQAFAAMRAATEKVALAARSGSVGSAGDAEWAEYKRLRVEADRLRADAIACRARPAAIAAVPAPVTAPVAASVAQVDRTAGGDAAPRFRIEASVFEGDRQPTSAGRFNIQNRAGYAYSTLPGVPVGNPPALSSDYTVTGNRDSASAHVRSWSSGLTIGGEFAPDGIGREGWRFTTRLGIEQDRTKSHTDPLTPNYVATGPSQVFVPCQYYCSPTNRTPVTLDVIEYRVGSLSTPALRSDDLKQVAKRVDFDGGAIRDFALTDALGGLRASLGAELGFGWWTVEEREWIAIFDRNIDVYRSADGPVGRATLTAALSGPLPVLDGLSWSLRSRLGYEIADITATSKLRDINDQSSRSTVQDMNDGILGSLGVRLDYTRGPVGGFVSLERRRDLALASVMSARGTLSRASKAFDDGSAVYLWPVYSSRLTVGVNYGF